MESDFRRMIADSCATGILQFLPSGDDAFDGGLRALLAEYANLKRENGILKRENAELRKKIFRCTEDLLGEEWRDVIGYEGAYQVSNKGRVRSFYRNKIHIMTPTVSIFGYARVMLSKGGDNITVAVHRLVAKAFIPNPDNKPQVNHVDSNRLNNCVENLEWVTTKENVSHSFKFGFRKVGCEHFNSKLGIADVKYIRKNPDGLLYRELAEKFNVSISTVGKIITGKTYKSVK